jgi:hypothetical protein
MLHNNISFRLNKHAETKFRSPSNFPFVASRAVSIACPVLSSMELPTNKSPELIILQPDQRETPSSDLYNGKNVHQLIYCEDV